ncbi:MAG: ATP-binding cassette domain-containing protein [Gammaproteobacteria bacterium]
MERDCNAMLLQTRQLSKWVTGPEGRLDILRGVDLDIAAHEAVAILGASGSGKTTLLGLLAGLDAPSGGDVILLGKSLHTLDEDARAALRAGRVGFVFQSFQLLPTLTAVENVHLALELAGCTERQTRAWEALDQVGLSRRLHHYPSQLSGGEQQRVAIARAFAPHPEVLFADEPTGNLDQSTGDPVIELLFSLRARYGTALVLVTHDAALAQRCERRYRLDNGILAPA